MDNKIIKYSKTYGNLTKSITKLRDIQAEYRNDKLKWCKEHNLSCDTCPREYCELHRSKRSSLVVN